jgi:Flp pilus assembly protein TadD
MSRIAGQSTHRYRRALTGAPAAVGLALLLAGCQIAGQCAPATSMAAPPPCDADDKLMRVADDTGARGDPATALGLYRRLHEKRPNDPEPLARIAATLVKLKDYSTATEAWREAIALAPDDPTYRRGLAAALLSLGQPEPAIAELEIAVAARPDDPRLLNTLGVAHDIIGRHDLAQEDYRKGLRLAPHDPALRNNFGLSLALSGDYGAAAAALEEVVDDPTSPPRYRLNLALVYGLAGDTEKASAIARGSLPEDAVRNNLAYYAMLRGMDDRARVAAILGGHSGISIGRATDALDTAPPLAQGAGPARKVAGEQDRPPAR